MIKRVLGGLAMAVVGMAVLAPSPAQAYRVRGGWGWRAPLVVVPPPVVVGPRPVYIAGRRAVWIPPHYNRWGGFIPGHWG